HQEKSGSSSQRQWTSDTQSYSDKKQEKRRFWNRSWLLDIH
ncbi:hypothetical protein CDAR_128311, partial [Caerostris darwini]